tara:strand:- start:2026 stop:2865 length:840 start_codon:yes stop_codon:yes gene_type:complete
MSDDELTLDDVTEDIPPQIDDEEVEEVEEDSTDEPESGNPAWDELLDVLPKSLHGMVKPVLDKWQSGIDSEFEKIAPYRKFADADVNPQIIEASMDLARQVQSNPKAVYDELAQRYGWSAAQQIVEEASENLEEAEEMDLFDDSESTSELKALKSELDALKSTITSQQEASEQEALSNQIEESLQSLGKEAGDFDQEAVVRRAMLLADDYPDADIAQLIQAGYEQYSGEVEKMRSSIKKAPRVAGGSANKSPAAPVKTLNTREDRINAIEEIVKRTLNI